MAPKWFDHWTTWTGHENQLIIDHRHSSQQATMNTTGLRSTICPEKHDSADWTPNGRAAAMWSAGKRVHACSVAPHAAAEGDV